MPRSVPRSLGCLSPLSHFFGQVIVVTPFSLTKTREGQWPSLAIYSDYQRPYAWTIEQVTELLDDLYSAMQDTRTSGASSQYFLGSIVLIKNDREPKSLVVDGQQRLSTLTMLFAVLRTVMREAADGITDFLYKRERPVWVRKTSIG